MTLNNLNIFSDFTNVEQVIIPSFNVVYDDYSLPHIITANKNKLLLIKETYSLSIKKWGDVFEIFEPLLVTLIAIESGGKNTGKNSAGAIGLMQVKEITVREAVSKFKIICGVEIPESAKAQIKLKASYLLKLTPNQQQLSSSEKTKLEKKLTEDTDFNIMIGCLAFRFALEFTKVGKQAIVDKSIIAYNTGVYGRINSAYKNKKPTTLSLFKDKGFAKETRNYLAKSLGVNGFWSLLSKL
jgi:hypothetical protein